MFVSYGEKKRNHMAKQSHKKIEDRLFRPARAHANSHPRSGPLARSTSHARGERRRTQQSSAAVRVHISLVSRRVASVAGAGAGAGYAIGAPPIRDPGPDLHGAVVGKISRPRGRRARPEARRWRVRARARLSRRVAASSAAPRHPRAASGRADLPDRPTRSTATIALFAQTPESRSIDHASLESPPTPADKNSFLFLVVSVSQA
jgi:hypothetical protein